MWFDSRNLSNPGRASASKHEVGGPNTRGERDSGKGWWGLASYIYLHSVLSYLAAFYTQLLFGLCIQVNKPP